MSRRTTPSQTVGPFFHLGLGRLNRNDLAGAGDKVMIEGRVLDGDGAGVCDALIEIWLADSRGRYASAKDLSSGAADSNFNGFGRIPTDSAGAFRMIVPKPGSVVEPGGVSQAPHIVVTVFARGLLKQLITRIYFPNEPDNGADSVLSLVPAGRRATLIARPISAGNHLEWNIVLQGEGETVFFEA